MVTEYSRDSRDEPAASAGDFKNQNQMFVPSVLPALPGWLPPVGEGSEAGGQTANLLANPFAASPVLQLEPLSPFPATMQTSF